MVASVGKITAGSGYDYLTRDVATSKHDYYTGRGEAPGQWTGRGSALIGLSGHVDAGDMAALYGRFVVPSTVGGVQLPSGRMQHEQVLGRAVTQRTRADGTVMEPIAAFDVTFSPAKSVSVLFALTTSEDLRAVIIDAHEDAVADGLAYLDTHAGHTRAGVGGVRKVAGEGLVVAQFRHRTARSTDPEHRVGDPQLHSHCAILNRVRGVDGKWRTLDGQAVYRHAHAAGGVYAATFERLLSQRLGMSWREPDGRVPMREIDGVNPELVAQFSTRRFQVLDHFDRLESEWRDVHGRSPLPQERAMMLNEATVRSRAPKVQADVDLYEQWRAALSDPASDSIAALTATLAGPVDAAAVTVGGRLPAGSDRLVVEVVDRLQTQRAWWTRAHITAEVARLVEDPTPERIELEVERVAAASVVLTPDDDPNYADPDRTSFTSERIQTAETEVLASTNEAAPYKVAVVDDAMLGDDQRAAVEEVTSGDHRVTTVIGPAGAGKTTMLRSVAASYEAAGRGLQVLSLSANAAQVVTEETGIAATTAAMWQEGGIDLPRNGVVIVDEASMMPTLLLEALVKTTRAYKSRLVFVGDYAQLGAPAAGGLLRDLAVTDSAVELVSVRRFTSEWERAASKHLRARNTDVADAYDTHGRLSEVLDDEIVDTIADAWYCDVTAGRTSLVVADSNQAAAAISARCQQLLHADGQLGEVVGVGVDGNQIRVGDTIQTRTNTNDPITSNGRRVLNRDVWKVTGHTDAGDVLAQHLNLSTRVALPAAYIPASVQLAYASTIHGAQGRTVDRGHVAVTPRTQADALYVGMTRGRNGNHAWCVTNGHDHDEHRTGHLSGVEAFRAAVVRNPDGQVSATSIAAEWVDQAPTRATDRRNDHARAAAETSWATYTKRLTPRELAAIEERHIVGVVQLLTGVSNPHTRREVLLAGHTAMRQRLPYDGDTFLSGAHRAVSGGLRAGPEPADINRHATLER